LKIIIAAFILISTSPYVHAAEALLFERVPAAYIGKFQWEGSSDIQQVVFVWEGQSADKEGKIFLQGKGVYGAIKKTNINLKAIIDPLTYQIEIWESVENKDEFLTSGSHVGTISTDLKTIEAVWAASGSTGSLQLIKKESHSHQVK